mmetsp:Transcript_34465/g.40573  ORF Transcript_34465/g.40573 Transcript_34465/m.40573 type:complete len:93 (-) Transcript_34465:58-336(-)
MKTSPSKEASQNEGSSKSTSPARPSALTRFATSLPRPGSTVFNMKKIGMPTAAPSEAKEMAPRPNFGNVTGKMLLVKQKTDEGTNQPLGSTL